MMGTKYFDPDILLPQQVTLTSVTDFLYYISLQGQRPVTLIGFSLGARVIFYCLKELAAHPRGAGIVENAYLLGAPVPGNPEEWQPFSKVVAGRIVNAYIRLVHSKTSK